MISTTIDKPVYGADAAGCWVDCHRGIYIGEEVIQYAREEGWNPETEMPEDGWAEHKHYHELWNEAEEFMQQLAAEGFYFGSSESGDWGLWAI